MAESLSLSFAVNLPEYLIPSKDETSWTTKEVIVERNGVVFAWNSKGHICATPTNDFVSNKKDSNWQVLALSQTPLFDVQRLLPSPDGCALCLIGQYGICIAYLPKRWGVDGKYEGGKDTVICRSFVIAAQLFQKHHALRVVHVDWFCGSPGNLIIVLLTSDNKIRMYIIDKPDKPVMTFSLFGEQESLRQESICSFASAFGEVAAGFDFGLPFKNKDNETVNPIYVLQENGDIWLLILKSVQNRFVVEQKGPLTMYPPSDDNYGSDYCSIVCLNSAPPVIALATCHGLIHHCIVLEGEEEEQGSEELEYSALSNFSPGRSEVVLHVFETIQLDFSLSANDESRLVSVADEEIPSEDRTRLVLQKGGHAWYYCVSIGGVHWIELPWIRSIQDYCTKDSKAVDCLDDQINEADVKFLLCTKPCENSKPCPVIGTFTTSVKNEIMVVCMLSNGEVIQIPLRLNIDVDANEFLDEEGAQELPDSDAFTSPIRHLKAVNSFDDHIRQILRRDTSAPLIRSGSTSEELSAEEFYQLLSKATKIIREEYIQKIRKARSELVRRCEILKEQKDRQMECMKALLDDKEILQTADALGDKVFKVRENMEKLLTRLETSLQKLKVSAPVLSNAEKHWAEEVSTMQLMLKKLRVRTESTKVKHENFTLTPAQTLSKIKGTDNLNASQRISIHGLLKEQSNAIAELVHRVKELDIEVGL